ncbi:MAG TPA: ATP-binding cassette domain-containing protein [Solirubrobacterales bacterium]|nr:ATP-binding cassette domain-containing protein [Solirubrobacterales bacterium]
MASLELRDLSKRYGDTVALDRLGFTVDAGQVFGFVGPNGAGKTTTMRIVMGVLHPDSGEVLWSGKRVDAELRRRFGYMPEERGLYPKMAVGEQLTFFAELHGLSAADARSSSDEWTERLGISDRRDDKVEELSLGNQQRVQLAAALVHEPELLVLDEPFSGLDPVGVDVLSEVLLGVARERRVPVIFSSHQLELVERLCDAVAIIRDGRLVATGLVDELRRRRAGRRWTVELENGDGSWSPGIAGIERVGDCLYELSGETDPQALLDAARGAGAVRRFGPAVPTLADLFRDVVGRDAGDGATRG